MEVSFFVCYFLKLSEQTHSDPFALGLKMHLNEFIGLTSHAYACDKIKIAKIGAYLGASVLKINCLG